MSYEIMEISHPQGHSIHATNTDGMIVASAEATLLGPGEWYVNRVVVLADRAKRGKGLGTKLLLQLLHGIRARDREAQQDSHVVVEPGGYGMPFATQARFYKRCNFKETDEKGVLDWRPTA